MSEPLDWNAQTIAEFRANEGRVGGSFKGAPMVLVHLPATRGKLPESGPFLCSNLGGRSPHS
jgi:hypothetical protein